MDARVLSLFDTHRWTLLHHCGSIMSSKIRNWSCEMVIFSSLAELWLMGIYLHLHTIHSFLSTKTEFLALLLRLKCLAVFSQQGFFGLLLTWCTESIFYMLDDSQAALAHYTVCLMRVVILMRDVKISPSPLHLPLASLHTSKTRFELNPLNFHHWRGTRTWKAWFDV